MLTALILFRKKKLTRLRQLAGANWAWRFNEIFKGALRELYTMYKKFIEVSKNAV